MLSLHRLGHRWLGISCRFSSPPKTQKPSCLPTLSVGVPLYDLAAVFSSRIRRHRRHFCPFLHVPHDARYGGSACSMPRHIGSSMPNRPLNVTRILTKTARESRRTAGESLEQPCTALPSPPAGVATGPPVPTTLELAAASGDSSRATRSPWTEALDICHPRRSRRRPNHADATVGLWDMGPCHLLGSRSATET